ncbi:MAG: ABC transporter permease [Candidatus Njordarchaeales archaeon]
MFKEFLILAFEALKERKLRASLTILMVLIGCSLLIAVDGISAGTLYYINEQFEKLGTNVLIVTPRSTTVKIDRYMVDYIKNIEGVKDAVPVYSQTVTANIRGEEITVTLIGVDNSKLPLIFPGLQLREGSYVPEGDTIGALVGYQLAYPAPGEILAEIGHAIKLSWMEVVGEEVIKHERSFIVRGILDHFGAMFLPVDRSIFISTTAAKSFLNRGDSYDLLFIVAKDPSYHEHISEAISSKYDVDVISMQLIINVVNNVLSAITFFVNSIALVSLIVAGVGIITTLWTSVMERIREIGVLKAIGFKNHHVLILFLNEAIIIGLLGSSLGSITGVVLSHVMKNVLLPEFTWIKPTFTIFSFIKTWALSIVLSIISGLYPAWRASKWDPVIALRYE